MKLFLHTFFLLFILCCSSYGQGTGYCGPYSVSSPLVLDGVHDTIISGLTITGRTEDCIRLNNCYNITIQKCKLGTSKKNGITISHCTNINVMNCTIQDVATGVAVVSSRGINVSFNDIKNVQGPYPLGKIVRFDNVRGANNRINYNVGENVLGKSMAEDAISLYMSYGTAADPIQVTENWIRGGGPSATGGGIMTGDNGGSYILVQYNTLVNPGQYGISISSGTNISIKENIIYAKKQSFTNAGIYVWNQYAYACSSNTISNNRVNWTNKDGVSNGSWNNGNCGPVTDWITNAFYSPIDSSILPKVIIGRNCSILLDAKENSPEDNFTIFRDPESKTLIIETSSTNLSAYNLYNINGQQITNDFLSGPVTKLDVSQLPGGIYFMTLINSQGIVRRKIILE